MSCERLAEELATLKAGLPALRDAVGLARGVDEKLQARKELGVQEHAVALKQAEYDQCAGVQPPTPPVPVALLGDTSFFIDVAGDGTWGGVLLREVFAGYTVTFGGPAQKMATITSVPQPVSVGGGFVSGGFLGLMTGSYFSTVTRSGGVPGTFDRATGRLGLPFFLDFVEGVRFGGFLGSLYDYTERAQGAFPLSTDTDLPEALFNLTPLSGERPSADGKVVLNGIGTVYGGANNGRSVAVVIDGTFFPWPPPP